MVCVDRKAVLGGKEIFEHVQNPVYGRNGLRRLCVFNKPQTYAQPSYAGRRWSNMVADIFGVQDRALVRLIAQPSYDGLRAVGDF